MTSSNATLKVKKSLCEHYDKVRLLNASDMSSLNGEHANSASYTTPARTSAVSCMKQRCETLYCDSKSTSACNHSNTLIENDKRDKSYLPTFCWNASKKYLNLNKEGAIIAEDTLLISDSHLTNSKQGEHTTNDPAP